LLLHSVCKETIHLLEALTSLELILRMKTQTMAMDSGFSSSLLLALLQQLYRDLLLKE
jgi:hypothetical protein